MYRSATMQRDLRDRFWVNRQYGYVLSEDDVNNNTSIAVNGWSIAESYF